MRLIDADELMEHVWRDKLDSRELIAKMIDDALTVKEISTKIPINVFERLFSQEPKTGHWIEVTNGRGGHECNICHEYAPSYRSGDEYLTKYCPDCGCRMVEPQESEVKE